MPTTPGPSHPVTPGHTTSHLRCTHASHNILHTRLGPRSRAHPRLTRRPLPPRQSPGAHTAQTHVPRVRSPARPRTRTGSHTPAFPVLACFSGNSTLRPPPPRPEVLAVFLAALVSALPPLPLPLRTGPPAPRGGPRPSPSPPSFQRGFPAAVGATDFPAGYVGSGEESRPELPPSLGRPRPGRGRRGMGARLLNRREKSAGDSMPAFETRWLGAPTPGSDVGRAGNPVAWV